MSKTTNKFAPKVHESAVRMVIDHECDYPSRWAALVSIAERIDCGKRAGVPAEVAVKMKALEREVRKSRQAYAVYWGASDGSSCSAGGLILNQSA